MPFRDTDADVDVDSVLAEVATQHGLDINDMP